ncbi:MAG: hypothetical protein M1453_04830 [Acidobacteria bacterium]|nr:hypothetical protein [Acidobacteriota bacterium]MCL5287306.1 hypothetical protein [Acidobacteriota bacterium]
MKAKRTILTMGVTCVLALATARSSEPPAKPPESAQKPAEPAVPPELQAAAIAVLGKDAEVLAFGDLAKTGNQQVLVINRIKKTPPNTVPGILLTRATILSQQDGKWSELLHVDEHLKNTNGFLAATPVAPVTGWRLQYEQNPEKGLQLYFTPLAQPAGGTLQTIGVRWNPKVKRYQSLDRTYQNFLGETPMIEKVRSFLR